jgi:cyanate lyase
VSDTDFRTPPSPAAGIGPAEARRRFEAFLPPAPFRAVDPALYDMRFSAGVADTVRVWLGAAPLADGDPDAALALRFAEGHLRRIHPGLMAGFDAQRMAGVAPTDAMAAAASSVGVSLHRPGDLASAPAPIDEALVEYVAAGNRHALGEVVEALGRRRDDLWRRSQDLAARQRALAGPAAVEVTPAAVAGFLAGVVADTGDDLATVAAGLGVDEAWVRAVLGGEVAEVDGARIAAMCAALEADPEELFGPAALSLDAAGQELVPPPATTAAQMLVDVGGFLRADELAADIDALDDDELAGLVRALATRHAQLEAWADDLESQQSLAVGLAEPVLPASAVAAELVALVAETGDDLDTVAAGLGLAPAWARDVVAGRTDAVDVDDARRLCDVLDLDPVATFGPAGAVLAPDRWAVVPYDPFIREAHAEPVEAEVPAPVVIDLGP